MSKQSKPRAELPEEIPDRVLIVTSRGVEVECLPIGAEIEEQESNIRARFTWPAAPQRVMVDVAGTQAHVDLTPEFLKTPEATEEQKSDYAVYKTEWDRVEAQFQAASSLARARLIALRGMRLTDPALADLWAKDHEWLDMVVPADPRERAMHFFLTEIVGNAALDTMAIMVGIYKASGMDPEVLARVEASFRNQVGGRNGADAGGNTPGAGPAGEAAAEKG